MALPLKQSTTVTIQLGPFVDSSDGVTAETGLTVVVKVSKNGAAYAARSSATAITHDADGWYRVELNTTDTNTLGIIEIQAAIAGAAPVWKTFTVYPAVVYDSLILGTDLLQIDVTQWLGVAPNALVSARVDVSVGAMASAVITAASIASAALTNAKLAADFIAATNIATGAITAAKFAANAIDATAFAQGAADKVWSTTLRSLSTFGTLAADVWASVTRTLTSGANIALAKGTGLTGLNDLSAADVNTEATSALTTAGVNSTVMGRIDTTTSSRATPAQVNTEMLDVLTVDTYAEPSAVPTWPATILSMIRWPFTFNKNEVRQTAAGVQSVRNDANSADIGTATVTDNGTTSTRGEFS